MSVITTVTFNYWSNSNTSGEYLTAGANNVLLYSPYGTPSVGQGSGIDWFSSAVLGDTIQNTNDQGYAYWQMVFDDMANNGWNPLLESITVDQITANTFTLTIVADDILSGEQLVLNFENCWYNLTGGLFSSVSVPGIPKMQVIII